MSSVIRHMELPFERRDDFLFLTDADGSYTYNECMKKATAAAVYLDKKKIRGKAIGIRAGHRADTVIAFLGILLSGNYYVPVSDEAPEEFLEKIRGRIETAEFWESCPEPEETVSESDYVRLYESLSELPEESPMYVVFTSGSTGVPKGIVKSHRSMMNFIEAYMAEFGFDEKVVLGCQTPFYFDASAKDIYVSLAAKCRMVIFEQELFMKPKALVERLNEERVSVIQWVPSALSVISTLGTFQMVIPEYLKQVFFVGETFDPRQLGVWMDALPDTEFINLYGSSEMAGICAFHRMGREEFSRTGQIPIGKPLGSSALALIDEQGEEVTEHGKRGEIRVCSEALADGYLNEPEKSAEVFAALPCGRCFYTGDLAEYDEKGRLVFAGRDDFQIKHMGHRIELEDIEAAAMSLSSVDDACCIYHRGRIVLFVTGEEDKARLTRGLKEKLPAYMLPNKLETIDRIPLNANGKKDRGALKDKMKGRKRRGRDTGNHT